MSQELLEQAKVHIDRNEVDGAITALINYIDDAFGDADALFMLGGAYITKGHPGIAAVLTKHAIEMKRLEGKHFPEAWMNLGSCFRLANNKEQAMQMWKIGLEHETIPLERARFYGCLATACVNEGIAIEGLRYSNEALKLDPGNAIFHYNRGLQNLELGNWREGWKDYEAGFKTADRRGRQYGELPAWDGSEGKTVIVWGEQGIGDEIMFASCLPDVLRRSKHVIFDCHPRLVALFQRSFPEAEIHGTRKQQTGVRWVNNCNADAHICVSSLPLHFRNRTEDFPGTPYLKAATAPGLEARHKGYLHRDGEFQKWGKVPRIGLSWMGGTHKTRADLRSVPLNEWLPILKSIEADFYSLQYGDRASRQACALREDTGIDLKHYPGWVEAKDYDKTASFVASMDLVITVNTTMHHLAGSLGVPTWTLTPSKPAWRYGLEGEDCPWYKSVKLIRQQAGETWEPVIKRVAADLAHHF